MLSPRWRKVLRDVLINRTRTILVVLSIAIGVFAVGMIAGSRVILSEGLNDSFAALSPAHAMIWADKFDDDLVQAVRGMKEIKEAEGRRILAVRFKVGPDEWRSLQLFAIPDYNDIRVNKVRPVSGAWPPAAHELLIERASLDFTGANVGDKLLIELPGGRQRELRIGGVARDITQSDALLANSAFGYISFDTLEWLGAPRDFDQLYIVVAGPGTDKAYNQRVANLVRDKIEQSGRAVLRVFVLDPGKHPADTFMQTILLILGAIGFLSLVLSGFLVVNIISALLAQQIRQIGMMKAVGARRGQLARMYFGTVLIFGILSLGVAVPLGALAAHTFAGFMARFLNFDIASFSIPPQALWLEVAVGLFVPLLAALWPIIAGTRVTVREAISSYGLGKGRYGQGLIDRLVARIAGLPRPLLISLRNTFRRKGRLALTLITLTMATTIFVVVFSLRASMLLTLEDVLNFWSYDVLVQLERPYRAALLEREALQVPGVTSAESWYIAAVRRVRPDGSEADNITMYGLPPATKVAQPTILEGRWLLPDDENAVVINADVLRDNPDAKVGDDLVLKLGGKETTWRVVGLIRGLAAQPYVFANYTYLSRVVGDVGRASWVLLKTEQHDMVFQTQLGKALEDQYKRLGLRVGQMLTIASIRQQIEFFFNVIIAFLLVMAVLLGVVGGLGLMGTMSINVIERTREIGVMRAIGASDGTVLQIVLVEGILISVLSWAAGTIIALPLSKLLSDAVGNALFQTPLSYVFSTSGALLWLGIVVALAALASFLPAWNASRLTVRDVLAYE